MRVPIAYEMQSLSKQALDLSVLPLAVRVKPSPATLVSVVRSSRPNNPHSIAMEFSEELAADLGLCPTSLAMRAKVLQYFTRQPNDVAAVLAPELKFS